MKHVNTRRTRLFACLMACILLLGTLFGCKSNTDAPKYEPAADGTTNRVISYSKRSEDTAIAADVDISSSIEGERMPAEKSDYDYEKQLQAGALTGSEWCDNDHWNDFISKLLGQSKEYINWMEIAKKWDCVATKRLHVHVTNGETPVKSARVVLLDAEGQDIWRAVSDANGDAYLFWNVSQKVSQTPATVVVNPPDGVALAISETKSLEGVNLNETLEISLAQNNLPISLDLLFTIDTTGSMADELEYLKVELGDVVKRVVQDCQISARTSVNFYRDEGDDYLLRDFPFTTDLNQTLAHISAQSAGGGGDYPEAVHTALANAINGHEWNAESVKILVLVLDAPPHENDSAVLESLSKSIKKAAEMGIRIIPVASSGVDTDCQILFRSWAALTGGTYTYLTDDSGIGNSHEKPDVEEVNVEFLNDMLVRIISSYCK